MVALLPTDAVRRAGTRVAPIGVRLRLDDSRELLPSPLWGGVGGGGRASLHSCAPRHDPPPHPPPQGGRESLRLNLTPNEGRPYTVLYIAAVGCPISAEIFTIPSHGTPQGVAACCAKPGGLATSFGLLTGTNWRTIV